MHLCNPQHNHNTRCLSPKVPLFLPILFPNYWLFCHCRLLFARLSYNSDVSGSFPQHDVFRIHSCFISKWHLMWICYSLFTHSSLDGHVGCFQCFSIINKVAMNVYVQVFLWTHFLLVGTCLKCITFQKLSNCLPFCIPTSNA